MTYADEAHARHLRNVLSDPENAAALVAWDRDIEPLLSSHASHWGGGAAHNLHVSMMPSRGRHACCHFVFNPDTEAWERKIPHSWLGRSTCPVFDL